MMLATDFILKLKFYLLNHMIRQITFILLRSLDQAQAVLAQQVTTQALVHQAH